MSAHLNRWRVEPGARPHLNAIDEGGTAGAPKGGDKVATQEVTDALSERLGELQDRLWAEKKRAVLLVLQALDAGGKDGTVKKVCRAVNPMGLRTVAFKAPNEAELAHDFLWRVHKVVPELGEIGVFNRSHYEDVLIARVNGLVPEETWRGRYRAIRGFERMLARAGTEIVKVYLHISRDEQAERFRRRLTDPAKNWKFNEADLDVRRRWDDYRAAYEDAMEETGAAHAPWYVVPADHKWYRNWAVTQILVETLEAMAPAYPKPTEDLSKITIP